MTPTQAKIMGLLLSGRLVRFTTIEDVLWPIDADLDCVDNPWGTTKVHISMLRRRMPLCINSVYGLGYILEIPMSDDHTKTRAKVDQALTNVRGALKERVKGLDIDIGQRTYDHKTGKGMIGGSAPGVDIEIIVTPKPEETTNGND